MPAPILIEEYDPDWPLQFERIKDRLLHALRRVPLAIEHVGSTSVPGLAAKPVLDIDIAVRHSADTERVIEQLATLGYAHRGDLGIAGREAFKAPHGTYAHHLYVVAQNSKVFLDHIHFRDRLRSDPAIAGEYGELKIELARKHRTDRAAYTSAKTEFIRRILAQAPGTEH